MEITQASEGHSLSGECRQGVKLGHRRNPNKQGTLTNWRVQANRQVRTQKESEQARGTHFLKSADRWSSQDKEIIQASKGHSLPKEHRQMDKSGHGENLSKQGALTSWRMQTDGQVIRIQML